MLMIGPPGAGKSMLAARLPALLPPLTDDEALTSAAILSSSRAGFSPAQWRRRPFRAPHHSSSSAALVGGRNPPQPGEITLAHLGVLFLDEPLLRCFWLCLSLNYISPAKLEGGAGGDQTDSQGKSSVYRRRRPSHFSRFVILYKHTALNRPGLTPLVAEQARR